VTELLELQPFINEWQAAGFELVLIASADPREVKAFMKENRIDVMVLSDRQRKVGDAYRVQGIPLTVFVDRNGTVQHNKLGWGEGSLEEFKDWVDKLT